MHAREYLLSYGPVGDFGRFRAPASLSCRRGDRVVVRGPRGVELAQCLCEAQPGHVELLEQVAVGDILRPAATNDLQHAERLRRRSRCLLDDACAAAARMELPLAILDGEILLDGGHAILYYLTAAACDALPLLDFLAERYRLPVSLYDLALPREPEAFAACGEGKCGEHGCNSCGSCGSCGSHAGLAAPAPEDLRRVAVFST